LKCCSEECPKFPITGYVRNDVGVRAEPVGEVLDQESFKELSDDEN